MTVNTKDWNLEARWWPLQDDVPISTLSPELFDKVISFLPPVDRAQLAGVCRTFYHRITTRNCLFLKAIPLKLHALPEETTAYRLYALAKKLMLPTTVLTLPDSRSFIFQLKNGFWATSSASNTNIHIWEQKTGKLLFDLEKPKLDENDEVLTFIQLEDGHLASSYYSDYTVRIWDQYTGEELFYLEGHQSQVFHIKQLKDGRLITLADDASACVWDLKNQTAFFLTHGEGFSAFQAFKQLKDGRCVTVFEGQTTAFIWDLKPDSVSEPMCLQGPSVELIQLIELQDGQIATADEEGTVRIWNQYTGKETLRIKAYEGGPLISLMQLKDGRLATVAPDQMLRVWNQNNGNQIFNCEGHDDAIIFGAIQLTDGRLATASFSSIRIWDQNSGKELFCLKEINTAFNGVPKQLKSEHLVTETSRNIQIWDKDCGKLLFEFDSTGTVEGVYQLNDEQLAIVHYKSNGRMKPAPFNPRLMLYDYDSVVSLPSLDLESFKERESKYLSL